MKPVYLVAKLAKDITYQPNYDYIGIDAGASYCSKHKIPMVCAVGDFDSITVDDKEELHKQTRLIELPTHKDETDTEIALLEAQKLGYTDITLLGGLGGRKDHELANIRMMIRMQPPFKIEDATNVMKVLSKGAHTITKQKKYLSIFAVEDSVISLSGVAYPLSDREIKTDDVFTVSNEILKELATLTVYQGKILVIQSEDE